MDREQPPKAIQLMFGPSSTVRRVFHRVLRLAHEFNPQYLRVAEHIFGNPELVNAPETGAVRN